MEIYAADVGEGTDETADDGADGDAGGAGVEGLARYGRSSWHTSISGSGELTDDVTKKIIASVGYVPGDAEGDIADTDADVEGL